MVEETGGGAVKISRERSGITRRKGSIEIYSERKATEACRGPETHDGELRSARAAEAEALARAFSDALDADRRRFEETAETHIYAHNVVCTIKLTERGIELIREAMRSHNKYMRQKFRACDIVRYAWREVRATLLLFSTGSAVCVGVKAPEEALLAFHQLRLELAAHGYATRFDEFKHVNSVYTSSVNTGVSLARLYADNEERADWHPALFPGARLELKDQNALTLLFDTGQCVYMGVRTPSLYVSSRSAVHGMLLDYKDDCLPDPGERFSYRKSAFHDAIMKKRGKAAELAAAWPEGESPHKRGRTPDGRTP